VGSYSRSYQSPSRPIIEELDVLSTNTPPPNPAPIGGKGIDTTAQSMNVVPVSLAITGRRIIPISGTTIGRLLTRHLRNIQISVSAYHTRATPGSVLPLLPGGCGAVVISLGAVVRVSAMTSVACGGPDWLVALYLFEFRGLIVVLDRRFVSHMSPLATICPTFRHDISDIYRQKWGPTVTGETRYQMSSLSTCYPRIISSGW
jgi:hypothetical protein